ncbi:E3 ubiquitin-protein ligase UPL3 [Capsicum baccatum]|uniref:HECT-type E3 ubiquitin transferase n=1 Tax=Capsicum baccatum TaxID=33114 RepID=A0A2G2X5C5_CAPBA|nr:E3 ubiquitin-protein ligase UPL3 [Capsicum baccatum]
MLLAARALTYLVDIIPSSHVSILHYGTISCFIAHLLTIEYMDLAKQSLQALKKISQVHPSACLRAGTLMVVLSYLDFFFARVHRVALATAAHICMKLPSDASNYVLPMYFFRLGNERILGSSLNPLNSLKIFTSPVPALPRRMLENIKDQGLLQQKTQELQKKWMIYACNFSQHQIMYEIANELCRIKEEMSIDLSLEDVKRVVLYYGFVFKKEPTIETTYTTNSRSILQMKIGIPTSDEIVVIDSEKALQQNSKGITIASIVTVRNRCNSIYCDGL